MREEIFYSYSDEGSVKIFLALDGTKFIEEEKRDKYDNTYLESNYNSSTNIIFLDEKGERLPINNDTMLKTFFILINNIEEDKILWSWLDEWDVPIENGTYFYNEQYDAWEELKSALGRYQELFNTCKKVKEKFENALS